MTGPQRDRPCAGRRTKTDPWPDLVINVFDARPIADGAWRDRARCTLSRGGRGDCADHHPLRAAGRLRAGNSKKSRSSSTTILRPSRRSSPSGRRRNDCNDLHACPRRCLYQHARRGRDERWHRASRHCKVCEGSGRLVRRLGPEERRRTSGSIAARCSSAASKKRQRGTAEAQLMIRHPNNSGLQRDPINNYYIPAFFIHDLALNVGGKQLLPRGGHLDQREPELPPHL